MQTIWFPAPVLVLFRRLVNAVSTLSISRHYFQLPVQRNPDVEDHSYPRRTFKTWGWLCWASREFAGTKFSLAVEGETSAPPPIQPTPSRQIHRPTRPTPPRHDRPVDTIHRLMYNPALYNPVRAPRQPVVLCHGLYGFDVRGPASFPILQKQYWSNVLEILRKQVGAEVIVTSVPSTGSVTSRAQSLHEILSKQATGRSINFMAHSMGGLDCRHLISHIKPTEYTPVSLTTVATPHHGSPFMDWCSENLGLGKLRQNELSAVSMDNTIDEKQSQLNSQTLKPTLPITLSSLPSSFTTLLLSLLDSPAYANLSTTYLTNVFNPNTPDDPRVRYFSVAGRLSSMSIWHPLWLPKMVLDGYEQRQMEHRGEEWRYGDGGERWGNDGLVTVESAKWGEFLGILEECDHWELRGARGIELDLWGGRTGGNGNDGWAFGDWARFIRAWKKEEKKAKDVGAALSERQDRLSEPGAEKARALDESVKEKDSGQSVADEVVKASTEKLSAVFDWIVEQVPSRSSSQSSSDTAEISSSHSEQVARGMTEKKPQRKSELATKAELERFYIALCRKLHDEGL
ncbi:Alpha/Beta hydrolase protein [Cytidiella melzeri]|nr:Alpha/Beta hydrolase protein [Cytidiella melzeri]